MLLKHKHQEGCNDDPDSVCPEIVRGEDFWEVCKEMQLKKAFQQLCVRIRRQHRTQLLPCAKITDL